MRNLRLTGAWLIGIVAASLAAGTAAQTISYGEEAVAELVAIAASEKEPEARRARAIRELEKTRVRSHLSLLRKLLREERTLEVRLACACTLASLGDRKAPKDLLLVAAYDGARTETCSRSDVLIALGRLGDPAVEFHLERALQREQPADEPFFHYDACRALYALQSPSSRRLLLDALRTGIPTVRYAAITQVSRLALDPKVEERPLARAALVEAARTDPEEKVAEQAASALFWSGVDGPAFYQLLEDPSDPKLRARAARVMDRHYLSAPRLERLRAAAAKEPDPEVRQLLEKTLARQKTP